MGIQSRPCAGLSRWSIKLRLVSFPQISQVKILFIAFIDTIIDTIIDNTYPDCASPFWLLLPYSSTLFLLGGFLHFRNQF